MSDIAAAIAADKAIMDAATAGPWRAFQPGDEEDIWWWVWQESALPYYGGIMQVQAHDNPGGLGNTAITDGDDLERERRDAEFIAAARNRWPAYIAAIEAVAALVAASEQVLWPAANGYPSGWSLNPEDVRRALAVLSTAPTPTS